MFEDTRVDVSRIVADHLGSRIRIKLGIGEEIEIIKEHGTGKLYLIAFDKELVLVPKSANAVYIDLR